MFTILIPEETGMNIVHLIYLLNGLMTHKRQVLLVCGWHVKLCDPLVTHGPYLSSLEIKGLYIKHNILFTLLFT